MRSVGADHRRRRRFEVGGHEIFVRVAPTLRCAPANARALRGHSIIAGNNETEKITAVTTRLTTTVLGEQKGQLAQTDRTLAFV